MTGRNGGASLAGPRRTLAAVKKWLPVSQATIRLVHSREWCLQPAALEEGAGSVPALQAGGVHGGRRPGADQAALLARAGGAEEEHDELPFFNSRPAA